MASVAARFFKKNRPDHAPDWITDVEIGGTKYVLLQEDAAVVWAVNQNCLEFHFSAGRLPAFGQPDYIVFDIDPPSGWPFSKLQGLVIEFSAGSAQVACCPIRQRLLRLIFLLLPLLLMSTRW